VIDQPAHALTNLLLSVTLVGAARIGEREREDFDIGRPKDDREREFRQLVENHEPAVRRFVRRRASAVSVDDIVQEVFVVAWKRIDHIVDEVPEDGRTGWLCAVARRAWSRDVHRKVNDARRTHAAIHDRSRNATGASSLAADGRLVHASVALDRLPAADAELLTVYYWDQLDGPGLAAYLGTSDSAARQRLSRALKRLREQLAEVDDGVV
jgi:RNA polymerase sigma-70 factor (ECF subfamily)